MYSAELEIKDTTEQHICVYLDLLLSIGRNDQLQTSLYDKRDDFYFHITHLSFLIAIFDLHQSMALFWMFYSESSATLV